MPDLTGHMIIWGGLFAHGDGSTVLMKVVLGTTAFGVGGVTVWGCFSFDCKLDLYVLDGNLTGQKYRDNVLAPRVVPHSDNHALAARPMFMDDNARPHKARIVQYYLQQEAVQTIPWNNANNRVPFVITYHPALSNLSNIVREHWTTIQKFERHLGES